MKNNINSINWDGVKVLNEKAWAKIVDILDKAISMSDIVLISQNLKEVDAFTMNHQFSSNFYKNMFRVLEKNINHDSNASIKQEMGLSNIYRKLHYLYIFDGCNRGNLNIKSSIFVENKDNKLNLNQYYTTLSSILYSRPLEEKIYNSFKSEIFKNKNEVLFKQTHKLFHSDLYVNCLLQSYKKDKVLFKEMLLEMKNEDLHLNTKVEFKQKLLKNNEMAEDIFNMNIEGWGRDIFTKDNDGVLLNYFININDNNYLEMIKTLKNLKLNIWVKEGMLIRNLYSQNKRKYPIIERIYKDEYIDMDEAEKFIKNMNKRGLKHPDDEIHMNLHLTPIIEEFIMKSQMGVIKNKVKRLKF
jgi:hypothetical protein